MEMYEKKLLTAEDHEHLVHALDVIGASSSIDSIQEYRKQNSMPIIEVPQTSEQVTLAGTNTQPGSLCNLREFSNFLTLSCGLKMTLHKISNCMEHVSLIYMHVCLYFPL